VSATWAGTCRYRGRMYTDSAMISGCVSVGKASDGTTPADYTLVVAHLLALMAPAARRRALALWRRRSRVGTLPDADEENYEAAQQLLRRLRKKKRVSGPVTFEYEVH